MRRKLFVLGLLLLVLAGIAAGGYAYYQGHKTPPRYLTAQVERGQIAMTVNATGAVNAVVTVQVGSQVSGTIQKLFVDFNSPVTEGQVIAQIDPASLETRVSQTRANLASARAAVQVAQATMDNTKAAVDTARANTESAKANVEKARVALADARRTLERNKELLRKTLIPQSELDNAQTAYDAAVSQLKLSEAQQEASLGQLKSAQAQARLAEAQHAAALAQVEQAKATLQAAELDLQYTTIRAPVNGIVISRNVDVGQTVAASLQAPTLFLIAQDLTQMQVDTNVSEADIGRVRIGQTATFVVDAYPNTTFRGQVVQVRNAPITVQNVVTYNAVVQVANPELRLKPGMTANVSFLITERSDILKVPNAALRFQADGTGQSAASAQDGRDASGGGRGGGAGRGQEIQRRLTQALALSSDQQTQLGEILQQSRQRMTALREENLPEEQRRARTREIQAQSRTRIRTILNPEQLQKYEELLKAQTAGPPQGRPGRVWVLGADGTPEPRDLTLGIANDTHTEVLSGDLPVGQQVITGILAASVKAPPRPATPGFGSRRF
jgi:HlyD family secretion protein